MRRLHQRAEVRRHRADRLDAPQPAPFSKEELNWWATGVPALHSETRTDLINNSPGKRPGPQGLKPALLSVLNGTAEAVPYPKPFMRPVLAKEQSAYPATAAAISPGVRTSRIRLSSSSCSRLEYLPGLMTRLPPTPFAAGVVIDGVLIAGTIFAETMPTAWLRPCCFAM